MARRVRETPAYRILIFYVDHVEAEDLEDLRPSAFRRENPRAGARGTKSFFRRGVDPEGDDRGGTIEQFELRTTLESRNN